MRKQMLFLAALLLISLGAIAQKKSKASSGKQFFRYMLLDSTIRRISLILVMMRVRMIMNICLPRDGMV